MASGVGKKKFNVIHRTTSETIRLSEADILDETVHIPQITSSIRTNQPSIHHARKKVQSSFQITDVCLTRPDVGEESADDLDESHTDDNSRVTDNETPSFSEDSRDAEEHLVTCTFGQSSIGTTTAPVSSASTRSRGEKSRSLSSDSPNSNSFSRGRWTCLDYVDNNQQILDMDIADNEQFVNQYLRSTSALKNCELFFGRNIQRFENGMNFNKEEVDDAYRRVADLLTTSNAESTSIAGEKGGKGTVAIDSKIEQAMDLVKSHLMNAVRQDVNVLKLKISELLVKISQLESENLYLRAKASPEVLKLLEKRNQNQ